MYRKRNLSPASAGASTETDDSRTTKRRRRRDRSESSDLRRAVRGLKRAAARLEHCEEVKRRRRERSQRRHKSPRVHKRGKSKHRALSASPEPETHSRGRRGRSQHKLNRAQAIRGDYNDTRLPPHHRSLQREPTTGQNKWTGILIFSHYNPTL